MVHNQTKKRNIKKLLVLVIAVLLLAILTLTILEKKDFTHFFANDSSATRGPSKEQEVEQKKAETAQKSEYLDKVYNQDGTKEKTNTETADATSSAAPSATLELNAKQEDSSVTVLTKMQNVASGTCALTVNNGSNTVTQNAKIIYQPEFSSCAGFSIPIAGTGPGTWAIKILATTNNGSIEQATTIEVK